MRYGRYQGVSVFSTHVIGKGFGDAVIGFRNKNFIVEIKDPKLFKSEKKLSDAEQRFHESWQGQIDVVETLDDVLKLINRNYDKERSY